MDQRKWIIALQTVGVVVSALLSAVSSMKFGIHPTEAAAGAAVLNGTLAFLGSVRA